MIAFVKKFYPLLAVLIIFGWSATAIVTHRAALAPADAIILRIGHWQLEASVREALEIMAEDYRKIHPNVYIVQDAIPEMVYGQWTTTQLMGGTAPDLLQIGLGVLPRHLWLQYYNRYCHSMTRYANEPNPYNDGTELAGLPLRSTIKDGMRWTYIEEMQEYVAIPLSQFGVRLFYNRDLFRKLTGRDQPPATFREFIEVCETIRKQSKEDGEPYTAIAGSKYHLPMWEHFMLDVVTYPAIARADFNRDGLLGIDESYVATRAGLLGFDFPPYEAKFRMLRELTDQFQTGFSGLTRDEAVFQFIQQDAVFMATGTWDARSLQEQADGQFQVGVMDFPFPAPDDPDYGPFVEGPLFEQPYVGFAFAITHTSPHFEQALDFMRFMASQEQNEKLNSIIGWIPSVKGTQIEPMLEAFEPQLEGVTRAFNPDLGGETWLNWMQLYSLYQVDQLSYEELVKQYTPLYLELGLKDFNDQQRDWRRGMHIQEESLAGIRALALVSDPSSADAHWIKYRSLTSLRQVTPEIIRARQLRLMDDGPANGGRGPYEYAPEVLEKVRQRL
jgi:ABC-type glycerol-3-phosphate transport system substrate-binding protein